MNRSHDVAEPAQSRAASLQGGIALTWGLTGVFLLLGGAIYRLGGRALEAFAGEVGWAQWGLLAVLVPFMLYSEAYRGFHQQFSPRVAARASYLLRQASLYETVLAPLFLMAYIRAPLRRRLTSLFLTIGIVGLVLLVRLIPQPWRGIVDAAVVLGLVGGVLSTAYFLILALLGPGISVPPELPESSSKL